MVDFLFNGDLSVTELGMVSVFLGKLQWPLHFRAWKMLNKRSSPVVKPSTLPFRRLALNSQPSKYRGSSQMCCLAQMAPFSVIRTFCKFLMFPDRCHVAGKLFFVCSRDSASIPNSTLSNQLDCRATCFGPANLWGPFKTFLQVDVIVSYKKIILLQFYFLLEAMFNSVENAGMI